MTTSRLTIVSAPYMVRIKDRNRKTVDCECECGQKLQVLWDWIVSGRKLSCGCLRRDKGRATGSRRVTHGESSAGGIRRCTDEYKIWQGIIQRCCNQNDAAFPSYGGRGIVMCDRWLSSYEDFLLDVGRRPSKRHSLDRKDNQKGYSIDNCRWVTAATQNRNTRQNVVLDFNGLSLCVVEWAEMTGIPATAIYQRRYKKWDISDALTRQLRVTRRSK